MSGFSVAQYTAFFNGQVAAGGSINVYQTGTTTPVTIYADGGLITPTTNPMTLDSNGQAKFYVSGSVNLRIDSYTGPVIAGATSGAFIETVDPVYPVSGISSSNAGTVVYQGTNLTLATTNLQNNIISTAAINIALPLSTGFTSSFQCQLNAQGGAITLTCTSPDAIQKGAAGASFIISQGSSGELWTDAAGNWGINFYTGALSINPVTPQGRLTLVSNTPIMIADETAQTAIYYTPYIGNILPLFNGNSFNNLAFTQLTLTLNTTNHPTTEVFDIYASIQSGVITLSAMYWGSNSSRSTTVGGKSGTGNASITQKNGIWVNNAAISSSDSFNNATGYAIPQFQGTYLGTFYTTANGQTGVALRPSAANGGSNNIIGLFNAYNRQRINARCLDNTTSWTYASTSTPRPADNSTSNRITFIDGLAQINSEAKYGVGVSPSSTAGQVGLGFNSTTVFSDNVGEWSGGTSTGSCSGFGTAYPVLGLNFWQALELSGSGTVTFLGTTNSQQMMGLFVSTEL